ncbi:hypothetical protein ABZ644_10460, partial [Nocardiopsis alba]|uniref:hypothetical protein n=1 Tax=Nocardiopsis alba TaxID=53437 RepID=UPI0033F3E605
DLERLGELVSGSGADFGVRFDPVAERLSIVDTGRYASGPTARPRGGCDRSAVRVNVAVQERRLRGSAERSKPATIRSGCRTDL